MRTRLFVGVTMAALAVPTLALAQASTAGGAVGGAIVGGAVGGPVGAAVGAGVGATVGLAAEPPREVYSYVETQRVPSVEYKEQIVVGQPIGATVELRTVPNHTEWRYAVVNNKRVVVEAKTRKVVRVID